MPKRSCKDGFEFARSIVERIFKETEDGGCTTLQKKNPAAVALGRLGGKARAAALTPERRKEIAKKAAQTCQYRER